jgi:serine/threonine protein kinase
MTDTPNPNPVEELVFRCLESEDPEAALAEIAREHPELEPEVRASLERLDAEGLLRPGQRSAHEELPEKLGPFRLRSELGAGGMGIVYLAEEEGLGRHVALKLVRPEHLYFPGSRERFRREIEAVARLQHPGIISIYSVGEEQDIPYFAMEYVRGRSLGDVLRTLRDRDPASLTGSDLRAALGGDPAELGTDSGTTRRRSFEGSWADACVALMTQVAEALEHAHARGVLHRDIKPSNILVDPGGRACLLDFGLARTEGSQQLTQTSTQIGSLPYLPPEQLDESTRIPSERQDIYSFGVTLYELLALRSPFLGKTAEATRRAILDAHPARLRSLNAQVSWELETVCLTALSREPERRYASASALLRDLGNISARRPIEAKRASLLIRSRRWLQRNPTAAVAGGVGVVLTLIAALLFAWFQSNARVEAERLRGAAELARQEAEKRARQADEVTSYLVDLFRYASPDRSLGAQMPVQALLEQGASRLEKELAAQPEVRARLLGTFGVVHAWLDEPRKALEFYRRAAQAQESAGIAASEPERFHVLHGIVRSLGDQGRYDEAKAKLEQLEQLVSAQFAQEPRYRAWILRERASLDSAFGRREAATRGYERSLELLQSDPVTSPTELLRGRRTLAIHYRTAHRYAEAQELLQDCLEDPSSQEGHPSRVLTLRYAAENLANLGRFAEARDHADRALEQSIQLFGADNPSVARALRSAAFAYRESGDSEKAIELLERAHAIAEKYRSFAPLYFARMLDELGQSYFTMGRFEQAKELFERAREVLDSGFEEEHLFGGFLDFQLAECLASLGESRRAIKLAEQGLETIRRVKPGSREQVQAQNTVAWIATQLQQLDRAQRCVDESMRILSTLPPNEWIHGRTHMMQALIHNLSNRAKEAEAHAKQALEHFTRFRAGDHPAKALTLYHLAWARLTQGGLSAARADFERSIAMYRRLSTDKPYPDLVWPLNHLGYALNGEGKAQEAIPFLEESLEMRQKTLPPGAHWRMVAELNLGLAYQAAERWDDAEPLLLGVHEILLKRMPITSTPVRASLVRLADFYRRKGDPEAAARYRAQLGDR